MDSSNISIQDRTRQFANRVMRKANAFPVVLRRSARMRCAYIELNKKHFDDAGKILSKQFHRSGTSIGAIIFN